jgi:hypothetical protein
MTIAETENSRKKLEPISSCRPLIADFARDTIVEAIWGSCEGPPPEFRTPVNPPTYIGTEYSHAENYAHANERITAELDRRLEIAAEAVQSKPDMSPAFGPETVAATNQQRRD